MIPKIVRIRHTLHAELNPDHVYTIFSCPICVLCSFIRVTIVVINIKCNENGDATTVDFPLMEAGGRRGVWGCVIDVIQTLSTTIPLQIIPSKPLLCCLCSKSKGLPHKSIATFDRHLHSICTGCSSNSSSIFKN